MSFAHQATLAASIPYFRPVDEAAEVRIIDVIRQRQAFAKITDALQQRLPLGAFLSAAAECAATGCNAPMAKVLELRRADAVLIVKGEYGLGAGHLGREAGRAEPVNPPGKALLTGRPIAIADIREAHGDELPALIKEHNVVGTINIPLVGREGPYGILEVDYKERRTASALEISYLAGIAAVLAEGVERAQEREGLTAERDAKTVLLREQQHRIRNNFQLIVALLQRHGAEVKDAVDARKRFADVERRVFALSSLYDHLLGLGEHGDEVDLSAYIGQLCDNFNAFYDLQAQGIGLECYREYDIKAGIDICTAIGTVVNELVANAVEHAFGGRLGNIHVALRHDPSAGYAVTVTDDGNGFAQAASSGIGLRTARRLVANVGGRLELTSRPGRGTHWTISFPAGSGADEGTAGAGAG
jgi:two-component sensor histidine kinase